LKSLEIFKISNLILKEFLRGFTQAQLAFHSKAVEIYSASYKCIMNKTQEKSLRQDLSRIGKDLYSKNFDYVFEELDRADETEIKKPKPSIAVIDRSPLNRRPPNDRSHHLAHLSRKRDASSTIGRDFNSRSAARVNCRNSVQSHSLSSLNRAKQSIDEDYRTNIAKDEDVPNINDGIKRNNTVANQLSEAVAQCDRTSPAKLAYKNPNVTKILSEINQNRLFQKMVHNNFKQDQSDAEEEPRKQSINIQNQVTQSTKRPNVCVRNNETEL
jgi:hypothetical protein